MNQLETTLCKSARSQLVELRGALAQPEDFDRNEDVSSAYWMLSGQVMLAHIAGNGLSVQAVNELLSIERESHQLMAEKRSLQLKVGKPSSADESWSLIDEGGLCQITRERSE